MFRAVAVATIFLACATIFAGESPASIEPAPSAPPPTLGVVPDETNFDAGLKVKTVKAGSTAAALGIQAGDLIKSINGKSITSKDELRQVMDSTKVGDPIEVLFVHEAQAKNVTGTVLETRKIKDFDEDIKELGDKVDKIHSLMPQKQDLTLADLVLKIQEIEDNLPDAIAKFKQQYPNGEFNISFKIEIISDKTAVNPVNLMDQGAGETSAPPPQK
jgi:membrane-associated protease RseP (regulator of RpoE activity)